MKARQRKALLILGLMLGLIAIAFVIPGQNFRAAKAEAATPPPSTLPQAGDSSTVVFARRAALPFLPARLSGEGETSPAITRANHYRSLAGVPSLSSHPSIEWASQSHAEYYLINAADPEAEALGAHGEVEGKPGFTGRWPSDRLKAAGYPWFGGSEVMDFVSDPVSSVDSWISGIYHRVLILDPGAVFAGYGGASEGAVAVGVMDLGNGPPDPSVARPVPYPLAYPADGQMDVPALWNAAEWPDPLPAGASRLVGYPFTLQGAGGTLRVDFAELRDSTGEIVATHPSPAECAAFNCHATIPVTPLQAGSVYSVHAQGEVGDTTFDSTWHFTTAP